MLGKLKENDKTHRRYLGKLVFEDFDEMGVMEVVDDHEVRSLHFGTREKQSAMNLAAPCQLTLSYTKAMIAGLLFIDKPRSILNVGLGGGSLPKFMLCHYPESRVDVVEIREKVVKIAYTYFQLPRVPRLNVLVCDIRTYFRKVKTRSYDMIFLDAYNREGLSDSIQTFSFMNTCMEHLNPDGVLVANLWSEPEALYKKMVYHIFKRFRSQAMILPVAERSNHIAIGLKQPGWKYTEDQLMKRSRLLEPVFQIGLPELCSVLCENNRPLLGYAMRN